MKHRLTFIIPPTTSHPASPEKFTLSGSSLTVSDLHAAREDRFILQLDEFSGNIRGFLEELTTSGVELVLRWTGPASYESVEPFAGRATSGLNIVLKGKRVEDMKQDVCEFVKRVFGEGAEGCETVGKSFVRLPGDRYHFYSPIGEEGLKRFTEYIVERLSGSCKEDVKCISHFIPHHSRDSSPAYFDITFDPESKNMFMSVLNTHIHIPSKSFSKKETFWSTTVSKHTFDDTFPSGTSKHKVEVGVLDPRPSHKANEITLGGIIADLGESTDFEPVLFSFPSRHHISKSSSYKTSFQHPTGLHPKYNLTITKDTNDWKHRQEEECKLYAWFTLPKIFFVDKYQLSDPQLLKSLNIRKLVAVHGETDLEAPVWTQEIWGSDILVELESGSSDSEELGVSENEQETNVNALEVEIPFHLRYLPPAAGKKSENVTLPWPVVFWGCEEQNLNKIQRNPFERRELGWEFALGEDVVYHFIEPAVDTSPRSISFTTSPLEVPILDSENEWRIKLGTIGFVFLGFIFVVRLVLFGRSGDAGKATPRPQKKEKEKKVE